MSKKWIKERCPDCENKLDSMGMYNYCHKCKEYKFDVNTDKQLLETHKKGIQLGSLMEAERLKKLLEDKKNE